MNVLLNLDFGTAVKSLLPQLGGAFGTVIAVALLSFGLAMVLGLLIALGRLSRFKVLRGLMSFLIEIIRGTPLLVQLVYFYYVVPLLVDVLFSLLGIDASLDLSAFSAGVFGLGLNYGVLLSEVIRSAIVSIDKGQQEAALALGFGKTESLFRIILPQAFRNSVPVFGNYLATIVKDTSLLAYISLPELLLETKAFASQTFLTIESYTILACIYLVITFPLSRLVSMLERSLKKKLLREKKVKYGISM